MDTGRLEWAPRLQRIGKISEDEGAGSVGEYWAAPSWGGAPQGRILLRHAYHWNTRESCRRPVLAGSGFIRTSGLGGDCQLPDTAAIQCHVARFGVAFCKPSQIPVGRCRANRIRALAARDVGRLT